MRVTIFFQLVGRGNVECAACEARHYLRVTRRDDGFDIFYERETRKYDAEAYDDDPPAVVRYRVPAGGEPGEDEERGPIVQEWRRKRFGRSEVQQIWRATNGRCHLCGRKWRLSDRSRTGWHIDHVRPNVGGGRGTEALANLRVACAVCNLRKGRGYTERHVREALERLVRAFPWAVRPRTLNEDDWDDEMSGVDGFCDDD